MFKKLVITIIMSSFIFISSTSRNATSTSIMQNNLNDYFRVQSQYDDEFNGPSLNPNWQWYNEDPGLWSLTASPGFLRIIGTNHDMWKTCNDPKNLLLQLMPSGDFEMETKLIINPTINYQQGGLVVMKDFDNYLKFDVVWNTTTQSGLTVELIKEENGGIINENFWPWISITSGNPAYLKITRSGNTYGGYFSPNGQDWQYVGSYSTEGYSYNQIGIFTLANNCWGYTPDVTVDFDFFRVSEILPDIGFRPYPDGYHFENYPGINYLDYTLEDMRKMFGDEEVCRLIIGGNCEYNSQAREWNELLNNTMEKGHCYGMAVTSLRFFKGIDTHQFKDTVYDLNLLDPVKISWNEENLFTNTRRNIGYFFVTQWLYPLTTDYKVSLDTTPNSVLQQLETSMAGEANNPMILRMKW